jgi:hypothetical protein
MALDKFNDVELQAKETELLKAISDNGGRMGNTSLIRALHWPEDEYWELRERLVAAGRVTRGQGKGGSTRLVPAAAAPSPSPAPAVGEPGATPDHVVPKRMREDELYAPVAQVLRTTWARDQGFREVVAEITAYQGKRDTGGRWTRPDVTVASMTTLLYVPSKLFDVATFEPVRNEPDPSKLNDFVAIQFAAGAKEEILKWMR